MARRSVTGQLNMFDLLGSLDAGAPGEVEMVSLVPDFDEEPEQAMVEEEPEVVESAPEIEEEPEIVEPAPEVEEEPEVKEVRENVAMSRSYERDGQRIEIAYINYNKVRITKGNDTPIVKEFASTKEAVDYYVEQMQELEADE